MSGACLHSSWTTPNTTVLYVTVPEFRERWERCHCSRTVPSVNSAIYIGNHLTVPEPGTVFPERRSRNRSRGGGICKAYTPPGTVTGVRNGGRSSGTAESRPAIANGVALHV